MVYSSIIFLLYFLPLLLAGYYILPKLIHKNIFLFLFSLLFYYWGAGNLVIMLIVIGVSAWLFSLLIVRTRFKGVFLLLSVLSYIGVLIGYKYLGFIFDNLTILGIEGLPVLKQGATLGVSFFTLQAISYNIDVYHKNERFEKNPAFVILYISMFPQLISGPFVRYNKIEPQLKNRTFLFSRFSEGVQRFIIGLGKKILIADTLSLLVAQVVDNDAIIISPLLAWVTMIVFAVQIYFDFSGYTDMAIGVGKMLGFDLPENFNFPYISRSITEFWRRWHMSFTNWIKDYIFNTMAIQLRYWGIAGVIISLLLTFFVCGLWHGPSWNFILWGVSQGIFLVLEELFLLKYLKKLGNFAVLYVLFIIVTCLVFFRTADMNHAIHFFTVMFTPAKSGALGLNAFFANKHIFALIVGVIFCFPISFPVKFRTGKWKNLSEVITASLLCLILMFSIMNLLSQTYMPFIYFKF